MLNAYWEPLTFEVPAVAPTVASTWRRCVDTALASPDDVRRWEEGQPVSQSRYRVEGRSLVLLARPL
jgi:glycogen operon protein